MRDERRGIRIEDKRKGNEICNAAILNIIIVIKM